jgi:hypothetical protein
MMIIYCYYQVYIFFESLGSECPKKEDSKDGINEKMSDLVYIRQNRNALRGRIRGLYKY